MKQTKTVRPILVAVRRPSGSSRALLRKAALLAKLSDAPLRIVHVLAIPQGALARAGATTQQAAQADFEARTAQLEKLARLPELRDLEVSTVVRCDYPIQDALVREALERRARLLVAESQRQGRLARMLLSNIDWELIRNCPCPLWLSKTERFDRRAPVIAAVDPLHANAKPAMLDNAIVAHAVEIAGGGDRVTLCHAYRLPQRSVADTSLEAYWLGVPAEEQRAYEENLRRAVGKLLDSGQIPAENVRLVQGDPAIQLAKLAKKLAAGVVVMGAVSRRGLQRIFIGSTAERVIDDLRCDVLVIKPRGFKSPVDRQVFRAPMQRRRRRGDSVGDGRKQLGGLTHPVH
jgi:universal stress protein E